jgi:TPR repeat protein/DNA-binding CsgD family transcriptional regulator
MMEDYEKSVQYLMEAFNTAQKQHDTKSYSIILNNIGTNYLMSDDYDLALKYFTKAMDASVNYEGKASSLFNLGQVYTAGKDSSKFPTAHSYYDKALKFAEEWHNTRDQAFVCNRIGELYLMEGNNLKSLYYLNKSLKMLDDKELYYKLNDFLCMAENYILVRRYHTGIKTALKADSIAQKNGFIYIQHFLNIFLSEMYDSLRKPALAFSYFKRSAMLKDSMFNLEKTKRLNFMQTEFETTQHEMEAMHFQKQAASNNKLTKVYIIIGISLFLTLIYFIKNNRQKVKILQYERERLLQQREQEMLEKQALELELDIKHSEVLDNVLQINQQKELFTSILSDVDHIIKSKEPEKIMVHIKLLTDGIKNKIDLSDDWEQIKLYFEKVHPGFFDHLKNNYPGLSLNDLKLIAYTKLKFSNKEIGRLLDINPGSVQVCRYRLKKKMNIPEEVNFVNFMTTL